MPGVIDVIEQINAVRREVGKRVLEAGEVRVITLGRTYDTTIEDLWQACTSAERIPRWFLPISGDLRLGGRYQLEGNAGGSVQRCDPPESFAATWEFGGEVSWIEVRLSPDPDGGTRFELDHMAAVDDERWAQFGPGALGVGWETGLLGLYLHLRSGDAVDPEQIMAWTASPEGVRFATGSGDRWCEASVAAGTDPDQARAAADRTTAFYTTPPPAA
jgi:uncharacterized protein YndB with AHSA1/START domain